MLHFHWAAWRSKLRRNLSAGVDLALLELWQWGQARMTARWHNIEQHDAVMCDSVLLLDDMWQSTCQWVHEYLLEVLGCCLQTRWICTSRLHLHDVCRHGGSLLRCHAGAAWLGSSYRLLLCLAFRLTGLCASTPARAAGVHDDAALHVHAAEAVQKTASDEPAIDASMWP